MNNDKNNYEVGRREVLSRMYRDVSSIAVEIYEHGKNISRSVGKGMLTVGKTITTVGIASAFIPAGVLIYEYYSFIIPTVIRKDSTKTEPSKNEPESDSIYSNAKGLGMNCGLITVTAFDCISTMTVLDNPQLHHFSDSLPSNILLFNSLLVAGKLSTNILSAGYEGVRYWYVSTKKIIREERGTGTIDDKLSDRKGE